MKLGPPPELLEVSAVQVYARHQLWNEQVDGSWRSVHPGQEIRCIPDFLVGRPRLVRHLRLAFVRPKQVEKAACVDEYDRGGHPRLDLGEGVREGDRHAADTSSA